MCNVPVLNFERRYPNGSPIQPHSPSSRQVTQQQIHQVKQDKTHFSLNHMTLVFRAIFLFVKRNNRISFHILFLLITLITLLKLLQSYMGLVHPHCCEVFKNMSSQISFISLSLLSLGLQDFLFSFILFFSHNKLIILVFFKFQVFLNDVCCWNGCIKITNSFCLFY